MTKRFIVLIVALMASVFSSLAYAEGTGRTIVLVDEDIPLFTDKATAETVADMSATCNREAFDKMVAAKAKCDTDLASCSSDLVECQKVRDQCVKDAAEFDLLVDQALKACESPCKTAADLRNNPDCFKPKSAAPASKGPSKPKAAYCVDKDGILDSVLGHSVVVDKSDVIIVRTISVDGSVAKVDCTAHWDAIEAFAERVNERFTHVCYEDGYTEAAPNPKCKSALADAEWLLVWVRSLKDDPEYPLNRETWINVWNAAFEARGKLANVEASLDALEKRVDKLEKRADENDVKNEEQDGRLDKLERQPLGKTVNLRLTLEGGIETSSVTDTLFAGPRMDLIVIPSTKSGAGGYFGLSGGRGWVQEVGGVEQPPVVTTWVRTGFYYVLRPKPGPAAPSEATSEQPAKVSKTAFGLHLGGALAGAWPRESHQNLSAAGGEAGVDLFVGYFTMGLNLGLYGGSVARYEEDEARGGAISRFVYRGEPVFSPSLNIGFNL
jgi:hypothetical protein